MLYVIIALVMSLMVMITSKNILPPGGVKMKQFAVIGLGRFGRSIAVTLAKMGYDVLAIDTNEEKINNIIEYVTHAVQVDAMDEQAIKDMALGAAENILDIYRGRWQLAGLLNPEVQSTWTRD